MNELGNHVRLFLPRPWVQVMLVVLLVCVGGMTVYVATQPIASFERQYYLILPLCSVCFLGFAWMLWRHWQGHDMLTVCAKGFRQGRLGPFVEWKDVVEIKASTLQALMPLGFLIKGYAPRINIDIRDDASCLNELDLYRKWDAFLLGWKGHGELIINPIPFKEKNSEVLDALMDAYMAAVPAAQRDGDRCGTAVNNV